MIVKWYETRTELIESDGETDCCDPETIDEGEIDCLPDEDGPDHCALAARAILDKGCNQPSSSHFHPGVWYLSEGQSDRHTGDILETTCHLSGFQEHEELRIFAMVKAGAR